MPGADPPPDHRPHTDKYFIHSRRILEAQGLDPRVTYQLFIRKGPGRVYGIEEAVSIITAYSRLAEAGGEVWALPEGSPYAPEEPLMHITGPVRELVELETLYLGVISAATTRANFGDINLGEVRRRGCAIRELCPDKELVYFGARHWHHDMDPEINRILVKECGWDATSTDAGAEAAGLEQGVGTIPHALVLVYGHKYGRERGTVEATLAFDRVIDPGGATRRIALIDTFNREIDDSLATAEALNGRLWGVRLDTAGENVAQGGDPNPGQGWQGGRGVTISATVALRRALDKNGFGDVNIVLSSGFGDPEKVRAFSEAEKERGRLFEALGIGGLFTSWHATSDIVRIEDENFAKTGRAFTPNPAMKRVI